MKYRITEFKVGNEKGHRFFVEVGTVYYEKIWAFFYRRKITWAVKASCESFEKALEAIENSKPIYHDIK